MLRSLRTLTKQTGNPANQPDRLNIRAKSEVVRTFRSLHPPGELADLALERAGLPQSAIAAPIASDATLSSAIRRHRAMAVPDGGPAKQRLETLTSLSRTHGVSWDELDEIFFKFLAEREQRAALWQQERFAMAEKADALIETKQGQLRAGSLRKRRLAKLTAWSRKNLEFFKSEDLIEILNDVVNKRVIERETMECLSA